MPLRHYIKILSFPLIFSVLYLTLKIGWYLFELPSPEVLTDQLGSLFEQYGAITIFLGALVEGILLIGGYFPGVFVIFIGVIVAESATQAVFYVLVGTCGLLVGHTINYVLGRYGWYKLFVKFGLKSSIEDSKENVIRRGPMAIFSSYWLPSIAALTDTAAGVVKMPFRTFFKYSLISSLFWNTLVGAIVYFFNDFALYVTSPGGGGWKVVLVVVAIWVISILVTDHRKHTVRQVHKK
jgi:membrane protein DedA with SNARE-associated domain